MLGTHFQIEDSFDRIIQSLGWPPLTISYRRVLYSLGFYMNICVFTLVVLFERAIPYFKGLIHLKRRQGLLGSWELLLLILSGGVGVPHPNRVLIY